MRKIQLIQFVLMLFCLLSLGEVAAQNTGTTIKVLNSFGEPLAGSRIEVNADPGNVYMTLADGSVFLPGVTAGTVRISSGVMQREVVLQGEDIVVQLGQHHTTIELGYRSKRQQLLTTASVDVVHYDELSKSSVQNPAESLFGMLNGVSVLQNGGLPWARTPSMFVRGRGTYNDSSVLILVDGFERDIQSLSLDEIESVAVLKDGPALAMYGQRGANGVILVTTKRGSFNDFQVDLSFDQGFNRPFRQPEFLLGYDYARAVNEAAILDGNQRIYSDWELERFKTGDMPHFYPAVNWWAETLKDYGSTSNFNSTFRGGGSNSRYFIGLNYQNEDGLLDHTTLDARYNSRLHYERLNFRTNLDLKLTPTTQFQVNLAGVLDNRAWPGAHLNDRIMDALYSVPSGAFPVRTINNVWGGTQYYDNNPVALVSSTGHRISHRRELNADGRILQDLSAFVRGLSGEVAVAYDNLAIYNEGKTRNFLYENSSLVHDRGAVIDTVSVKYGTETDLSPYDNFGGQRRHGTLWSRLNYDTSWDFGVLNTSLMYNHDKRVIDGQYNTFLRQNLVATAHYIHMNRYVLDAALSYSGSGVLPKGNRFGFFPAVSAAWIMSQEDFFTTGKTIDYLKLRGSWALTGNDQMSPNLYSQMFVAGGAYFFTNNNTQFPGIREGRLAAEHLSYELARIINFGVDAHLFNALGVSLDVFHERRSNILTPTDGMVPSLIGVARPFENVGVVANRGLEASVNWRAAVNNFKYHIGGKFAFARNKIIEMSEEFQPYDYLRQTGNPIGQQYGLVALGFFRDQEDIANSPQQLFYQVRPGDIKYKDQNGDGVIDELDIVPIGYAGGYPEMYFSANLGFEFKGLGVDALFQGIANQTLYLNTKSVFWPLRGQNTISNFSRDRWTPETAETATLPRLSLLENANNYRRNDIWYKKGDYVKLRSLDVYYQLPQSSLSALNIQSARVFLRGMNLFSWDSIGIVDPEATGVVYPTLTSFHVGLNFGF